MYQALLTRRYLTTKVMPLLASLAVVLCTALVLITWSVMGGFLNMLIGSGRTMTGDVVIQWPTTGFAYYEDLIERLEKDPMIEAAAPMIEAYGIAGMPDGRTQTVLIRGVDQRFGDVTKYRDVLWWKPIATPLPRDSAREDPRLGSRDLMERLHNQGLTFSRTDNGVTRPAAVLGVEVSGFNRRDESGFYTPRVRDRLRPDGGLDEVNVFLPSFGDVTINVLPLDQTGGVIGTRAAKFPVANEFQSGIYELDNKLVLLRLDALQEMLHMQQAERAAEVPGSGALGQPAGESAIDPARVTHVLIRGRGDLGTRGAADPLQRRVAEIYETFADAHRGEVPSAFLISIVSWEDLNRTMIQAVEKETALVLFLFGIISLTAVFLVLAIFWSMVVEKTRDIGILRALGASRAGIVWLWLRYGLAIGLVGATLGVGLAYLVVRNINPIHEWMGRALDLQIWDPKIYYFLQIPNQVETSRAILVLLVFVFSSMIGALVPAARAARLDPVASLRFE